jgi:hypothetical protein
MNAVAKIEGIKSRTGVAYTRLLPQAGIGYGRFMRFKRRMAAGQPPLKAPGIKKTAPLDLSLLRQQIIGLHHGRKRTEGTGRLYHLYRQGVSRRQFNEMVREVRSHTNRLKAAGQCKVTWLRPNLAWALDGLEYRNHYVQNLQDLCSRYKFAPLTTDHVPCGKEVADHLSRQFARFGTPLFIKRDNGANLNEGSINQLLKEMMVIPINSPFYTASYNGAIEHSQGELKTWMRKNATATTTREMVLSAENAAHGLNHNPRRSLSGRNSCRVYFSNPLKYTKRQRKEAYDWVYILAAKISASSGKDKIDLAALRVAARTWMERHQLILIHKPPRG